jgi:ADP-ribose pyrophosphatase YjhB (NUDIX family)
LEAIIPLEYLSVNAVLVRWVVLRVTSKKKQKKKPQIVFSSSTQAGYSGAVDASVFSGAANANETAEQCVIREFWEESSLKVSAARLHSAVDLGPAD